MDDVATIIVLTLVAGAAMPAGALLACVDRVHPNWLNTEFRHGIIAFGGGALLSAIALVLVPEGVTSLSVPVAAASFFGGGVAFLGLDILLEKIKSPASQLAAMLSDFVPEAVALGASFASGSPSGFLLAGLITVQNLPEGFNAYREVTASSKISGRRVIASFMAMSLLGPLAGLGGYYWLSSYPRLVGGMMLFASGGILYLVFQDIAPDAKLKRKEIPAIGAVLGFLVGIVGKMLVEH
jgi:zinc transporter, ZIP family